MFNTSEIETVLRALDIAYDESGSLDALKLFCKICENNSDISDFWKTTMYREAKSELDYQMEQEYAFYSIEANQP